MLKTDEAIPVGNAAGNAAISDNVMVGHSSILCVDVIQHGLVYLRSKARDKQSYFSISLILPLKARDHGLRSLEASFINFVLFGVFLRLTLRSIFGIHLGVP